MKLKLSGPNGCFEVTLKQARIKYLNRIATWKIKAALYQQKRPVINGWRIEEIRDKHEK